MAKPSFEALSTGDIVLVHEHICSHSGLLIPRAPPCVRSTISCDRQLRS